MRTNRIASFAAPLALITFLAACGSSTSTSPPTLASNPSATTAVGTTGAQTTAASQTTPAVSGNAVPPAATAAQAQTVPVSPATVAAGGVDPNAPEVKEVGDIPDNQIFVPYVPASGLYSVSFPEGWSRTGDGDNVSFTDKLNAIEVAVVARAVAPTVDSVKAVDMAAIATKVSNYLAGDVTSITRKGGDAILATYEVDSAPNAVTGKSIRVAVERYEFWKSGSSVVVTLIGAVGADNVDPWKIVSDSFAWKK